MLDTLIIADDLTGALDSAVAFARPGQRVQVLRDVALLNLSMAEGADVLCINTNSREGSAQQAADKIKAIAALIDLHRVPTLIKKVDSRLKGHVRVETALLAALSGRATIIAAPAIPDMGRVQIGGELRGANDSSGISAPIPMAEKFPDATQLPDIAQTAEFDALIARAPTNALWVGARGLAFALARSTGETPTPPPRFLSGPMVFAVGSRDPISLAQIGALAKSHPIHPAPNGEVSPPSRDANVTAFQLTAGATQIAPTLAGHQFANGICDMLRHHMPKTVLACGGETANAILTTLQINTLDVIAEVSAGLPLCRAIAPWGEIDILTKSGGFGDANLLSRLAHMVSNTQNDLPNREGL